MIEDKRVIINKESYDVKCPGILTSDKNNSIS